MRTVWPMLWLLPDDGRHGGDRVAHRRPRGRADRAAAGAWSGCRRSISSGPAASIITTCRSRSRCWSSPRPCGPTACAGPRWRPARVTGLALAIGLECLPYLMVCAARLRAALRDRSRRRAGRRATTASRSRQASLAAFFVIVGPDHWTARRVRRDRDQLAGAGRSIGGLRLGAARRISQASACRVRLACVAARRRPSRPRSFVCDRAALPARALRHDGSGGLADLARACARDAAAHSADDRRARSPASRSRPSRSAALIAALVLLRDRALRRDFGLSGGGRGVRRRRP